MVVGGQAQIDDIKRFKTLTQEQEQLIKDAKKEDGVYSEGVLLSPKLSTLFRNVPPREYLSFVMTNPEQKTDREKAMNNSGISAYQAALDIANQLKEKSGKK